MPQNGRKNDLYPESTSAEFDILNKFPQKSSDRHPCSNFDSLEVLVSGLKKIRATGDPRSSIQDEEAYSKNQLALVEHPDSNSNCSIEAPDAHHVTPEHDLGWETDAQDVKLGSDVPQRDIATLEAKALDRNPSFREYVFDIVASTPHERETSSFKGRTGPMSLQSLANTKSVKDAGGACWRCKFVNKCCNAGDPCSSCPQKATPWHALGCRRGTLWDVLPRVILCPLAGGQSGSATSESLKQLVSDAKGHEVVANLATIYLPPTQCEDIPILSILLSSALRHQTSTADDQLIEFSLLCLRATLEAVHEQERQPRQSSHTTCTFSVCKVDSIDKVNTHLKMYIKLLSDVIFKKNAKLRKDWWLSVFYSFCIQSFVRRALVVLVSKLHSNQATGASQYLHLAVNLFFVTCNATGKGYDPLLYDFDHLSVAEISHLTRNSLQAENGRLAQIAVQEASWEKNGISSSYDYLGRLFDMDRNIFVPPTAKPPTYGDESEKIATVDEATQPPPKKRRLNQQTEQGYSSDDSITTQIPDTHIIHPGSLLSLDSTAELSPPIPDCNDQFNIRGNLVRFEGDMYTPRWVRGFRDKEGWCGFCSRWLPLGAAWFNDRCLFHGISAGTGKGFAEPKDPVKTNPVKQIWVAKCEACGEKVSYRKGDRRHYSNWFMHAANCGLGGIPGIAEEAEDDMAS